jgi:hypothetical protein
VGDVKSVFEGEVRARLDEEALMPAASWDAMMGGAAPPPAAAPRQVATPPTEKPASERVAEFVDELERLFPDTDGQVWPIDNTDECSLSAPAVLQPTFFRGRHGTRGRTHHAFVPFH